MKKRLLAVLSTLLVLTMLLPVPVGAAPQPPTNLAATVVAGPPLSFSLTWTHTRPPLEIGFRVMRAVAPSTTFAQLSVDLPAGSTSFTDETVVSGVTYSYQVVAFNAREAAVGRGFKSGDIVAKQSFQWIGARCPSSESLESGA